MLKKNSPLLVPLSLIIILFSACEKSTTSTTTLGDWKRSYEYEGVGRTQAIGFTIDNKEYVGLGFDGTNRLSDLWMFDESSGSWLRKADFPGVARNYAVSFTANGKGYVTTGIDAGNNKLNDLWEYDPATNAWTRKADFPGTPRYGAVAFTLNDMGYVSTGYDGSFLKDTWMYDPTTNVWEQKASLAGSKRSGAVAFVSDNKAYVVTGINNGSYLNDFWVYDPESNSWSEKRKISSVSSESYDDKYSSYITRTNAAVIMLNGKAYLSTGSRSGVIGTTWEYDISTDQWTEKTAFEGTARESAIGFTVNGHGYLVSGANSSFYFDDLWQFIPDVEVDATDN